MSQVTHFFCEVFAFLNKIILNMEGRYGLNYWGDMIYHFEYYSGDYDNKSLMLKEMSEAYKNDKQVMTN